METFSLIMLVFMLGIRHGLDADHLAFIDAQTRYNWRVGSPVARWVGTLFSLGHGATVAGIAIIVGMFVKDFKLPDVFDYLATWVSIGSLFLIGTFNVVNLLRTKAGNADFRPSGLKSRLMPRLIRETSNPFVIILLGVIFALAADTVSQTSVWAMSSVNSDNGYLPLILGPVFMIGMVITDTIDSLIAYRMISQTGQVGQRASRLVGWLIVTLAYGVALYETYTFFVPSIDVDFEIVGIISFLLLVSCFGAVMLREKLKSSHSY
jgi:high-affinity nickel-transport protein